MRKIFLLLIILISSFAFAQNADKATSQIGILIPGEEAMQRSFEKTLELFRTKVVGSSNLFTATGTSLGTTSEMLAIGFEARSITGINDSQDTLFVCHDNNFSRGSTIVRLPGEFFTKPLNWSYLFFKFGTTPTAGMKYRFEVE